MSRDEVFVKLFAFLSSDNADELWLEAIKTYLKKGGDVSAKYSLNSWTLLHYAAENLFCNVAAVLIENGAEVDSQASNGSTPYLVALDASIDAAIQNEDSEIDFSMVRDLVEHGANVSVCSTDGISKDSLLEDYGSKVKTAYYRCFSS